MIKKLLIANRGEIAIRIARTAARMGIETVAIYTSDDDRALHIKHADRACKLGTAGVAGYLDIENVLSIARETGCDAVHPGYGLLSERADFAAACAAAGVIFVGPSADALAAQGDKVAARAFAKDANVPVIQGTPALGDAAAATAFFHEQDDQPIMIKAVSGGGGRGMRIVRDACDIPSAFAQCTAEAASAFGSGTLYAEQFLDSVRHIEVQIVGDGSNICHLWERDCSIQRRNQKIVELAPAPNLDEPLRAQMLEAAIRIGRASSYKGVATVEFLVQTTPKPAFYFIETNPRIQVEHTVTEEVTGLDIVELQLRIAGGETLDDLGLHQDRIAPPTGAAIQLRVNTETYGADGEVTPSGGRLTAFQPPHGPGVRVDTYGYTGYQTNPNFDSLLAKLILHEKSGDLAVLLKRAERALSEFQITGCETNIGFLRALLQLPELAEWALTVNTAGAHIRALSGARADTAQSRYFEVDQAEAPAAVAEVDVPDGGGLIRSPIQAVLVSVNVVPGDGFGAGEEIAIVEAMKMQHVVTAPMAGVVVSVLPAPGAVLAAGDPVVTFERADQGQGAASDGAVVDPATIRPDLQALLDRQALTLDANRAKAVDRRRSRGQRTARENIADLCQGGEFHEFGQLVYAGQRRRQDRDSLMVESPADGIITGLGEVNADTADRTAAQVAILAYDASVMAGTQGMFGHRKTDRLLEVAHENKLPVVFYTEGGGGRPNDVDFFDTMASGLNITTFYEFARLHGRGPRVAVNSGFCFAGNAAIFGAADIKIATRDSWIGLGGPAMIEAGGLGAFSPKDVGPAPMQAANGLIDILVADEAEATRLTKQALGYFQGDHTTWEAADQRPLRHCVPENRKRVYDMRQVIDILADRDSFLELRAEFGPGMVTGLARVEGRAIGIIANNPHHLGGALDATASAKAASFLTLCNRFGLSVLSLCDTPGFMVGPDSEAEGGVQAACQFLGAAADLKTQLFFVCLRKGYGIGAQAMAGGSFVTPAITISWPSGEFGPMGLEGAVTLGFKRELEAETNDAKRQALFDKLVARAYSEGSALNVASMQEIDAVIDPAETRRWIVKGLNIAANTKK